MDSQLPFPQIWMAISTSWRTETGNKERRHDRSRTETVPKCGVSIKRGDRRVMQREPSMLLELGLADCQGASAEIDIVTIESDSLAHPHPSDGDEAEVSRVRRAAKFRAERASGFDQPGDLLLRI